MWWKGDRFSSVSFACAMYLVGFMVEGAGWKEVPRVVQSQRFRFWGAKKA